MVVSEKRIEDLKGLKFNVPSYQRGYRWTEHEVTTLLEDLYTHSKQNRDYKYCLQPLIVKKVSDNTYDVVDGQQRLTTIFIFLKFMSAEFSSGRRRSNQYDYFELVYETREQSAKYLKELNFDTYQQIEDYDIDANHISKAFAAIDKIDFVNGNPDDILMEAKNGGKLVYDGQRDQKSTSENEESVGDTDNKTQSEDSNVALESSL